MSGAKKFAVAAVLVAAALAVPAVVIAGPDGSATVRFGNPGAGSFVPGEVENGSFNAQDNMIPRTSVISEGGEVTFDIAGFHQPMIYEPGTQPEDIDVPAFPPDATIDETDGLVEAGPALGFQGEWTTDEDTFAEPGKYFVLCNFTPHFAFANMYGWVDVK
jgi:hypothetical protein